MKDIAENSHPVYLLRRYGLPSIYWNRMRKGKA